MPYTIRKEKGEKPWCVYNKESGEKRGCSKTYERAVAHMRLLYHVEAGGKLTRTKK